MDIELTMCGYLDDVVPVQVTYTRTRLRRIGYILYWVAPIDRYGYQTDRSEAHAYACPRRFWTMESAERHARETSQDIRERVAREANYHGMRDETHD